MSQSKFSLSPEALEKLIKDINGFGPIRGIELDTGTVYGSRYYTVQVEGGNWREMEKWCETAFGPLVDNELPLPNQRWYVNDRRFWFKSDRDRTHFVLRWSDGS